MRVLRISHSAVIAEWRERERSLRRSGHDVRLVSAAVWVEGGRPVAFDAEGDSFAVTSATWGGHPNLFLYDPRVIWRLLGEQHWDVIDIHEEPCSLAVAEVLLLRRLRALRVPYVLYSAQNINKRYPPPFRWTERYALRRTAGVSICNSAARRILVQKGLRSEAVLIPLGVDVSRFAPAQLAAPAGALRVGYVGRLDRHKGVHVLLDAAKALPNVSVVIVGSGPERAALERQAADGGFSERVVFAGALDHAELPTRYRSFDVVAVPSIPTPRWDEQFCRVAVEAMSSGVPVVASATGALPEVVGPAGLLVAPGDPGALAGALSRLVDEPQLWAGLRRAGLQRADQFTWDAVAAKQERLYRAAVGSQAGQGESCA